MRGYCALRCTSIKHVQYYQFLVAVSQTRTWTEGVRILGRTLSKSDLAGFQIGQGVVALAVCLSYSKFSNNSAIQQHTVAEHILQVVVDGLGIYFVKVAAILLPNPDAL